MSYTTDKIRNIALLGHGGSGKTSLAESMLFLTEKTDRLGKVADGNTVGDYDPEEIRRKISISLSAMYAEYKGFKVNILDTPGYFDFAGEIRQALRVADAGIIVVPAKGGIGVGTEKAWAELEKAKKPRFFYISKADEENGDYEAVYRSLREKFGTAVCPVIAPINDENGQTVGMIDLVLRKAYKIINNKRTEVAIPDDMKEELEILHTAVNESVAETSEELMEKYFAGEEFTTEEMVKGLSTGVHDRTLFPVFCGCAMNGIGTLTLLDNVINLFPSPAEAAAETAEEGDEVAPNAGDPVCALVYKTQSDQYGKFSFFKVMAGNLTADMSLINPRTGTTEKLGHIYVMQGKKSVEVKDICCGDLGAVAKLSDTRTGDTLCDAKRAVTLIGISFDAPCYSMAIAPKIKGQEDKIAAGLTRLGEEDQTFVVVNNGETKQMVLSGAGDIHLDVLCSKLKNKFGVEVELSPAKVPYRETVKKKTEVHGRHKKQSGGHGQFGDVHIRFEPQTESEDMIFADETVGGCVPKNFIPSVEKGLRSCISKGVLAGYPVVFLKATLFFGSYHPVDSSDMAFQTAASIAYKDGLPQANPVILEPIGALQVTIPDANMGDIIGDLNKRRGRVMGMNPAGHGMQMVEAEVPMAEMSTYAIDLRSMTQGRGFFSFSFVRYEETPANIQQKIIEDAKKDA